MKNHRNPFLLHSLSLAIAIALGSTSSAQAGNGTWNVDADGLWSTDTNWLGNAIANDLTSTANFTNNITADRTVHLDGDRTLNKLVFSDSNTATAGSWILDNNGTTTNNLILSGTTDAATGTAPVIDVGSLGSGKTATISAIIEGSYGFTKNGTGTLVLAASNTISGGITFTGGTAANNFLVLKKSDSAGTATFNLYGNVGAIKLDNTGTGTNIVFSNTISLMSGGSASAPLFVNVAGDNKITSNLGINTGGSHTAIHVDGGTLEISGNWYNSTTTRNVYLQGAGNGTYSGSLQFGNNNLNKAGAGTWTITNSGNNYTGATNINQGTLRLKGSLGNTAVTVANLAAIAGDGSIGTTGSLTFNNGSLLRVDGSTAGALTVGSGATGNLTLNATTTVVLDAVPAATGIGTSIRLINYNGTLSGSAGNLVLQNAFNYRNPSLSSATAKQVNLTIDTKALTWSGASAAWDINTSFNWDSGSEKLYQGDSVTFTDSGTTKTVTLGATVTPASVTFNNTSGNDYYLSGVGGIAGTSALTKTGTGTVTISNTNTYTGATTVSAGTLLVNGALGATDVTINSGAFGGSGTVGAGLTINSGSFFHLVDLSDALAVSGTVNLFAGFGVDDLTNITWGSVANGTYTLINGTLGAGVFAALANNSLATAYDIDGISGDRSAYFESGSLKLTVVPEPNVAALFGGLGLIVLLRRRRAA